MATASSTSTLASEIKALTFDVFGTVVDWRSSVEEALRQEAAARIGAESFAGLPSQVQDRARALTAGDWAAFAQEWRNTYKHFTLGFRRGETPWKDIDAHHRDSLAELLEGWGLAGFYGAGDVERLSKVWHRLRPWPDSAAGIHRLGSRLVCATLSNGNRSLLRDLNDHGDLGFAELLSAEDFRAYKPDPSTYLGACEALGLKPHQVAMVAAHLGDLAHARSCGLRTVYVGRDREEEWKPGEKRYEEARQWVDVWVEEDKGGMVEVARRLGI